MYADCHMVNHKDNRLNYREKHKQRERGEMGFFYLQSLATQFHSWNCNSLLLGHLFCCCYQIEAERPVIQ